MISTKEKDILSEYIKDISIETMPTFPLKALPKTFQAFSKIKAANSNINVASPACGVLFMASFLGHGLTYALRNHIGQELFSGSIATLWFAMFFESGKGKSESTEKWIRGLFAEYYNKLLVAYSSDKNPEAYEEVVKYGMYTSDTSLESLLQKIGLEGNFAVYTEEIETFFRQLVDSKGNDKSSPLLSIWTGAAVKRSRVNTQSQTKANDKPNMPILAFGQPFSVSKLFDGNRMASGFFQRWLTVYDNSPVTFMSYTDKLKAKAKAGKSNSEAKAIEGFIDSYEKGLEGTFFEAGVLNPTSKKPLYTDAKAFLIAEQVNEIYTRKQIHFKSITAGYAEIYSKASEYFHRLASCLWVLDSIEEGTYWDKEPVLTEAILARAYVLNDYFIKNQILVQKQSLKELGRNEEIVTIDSIVMNLNDQGSYSINGISEATGLPWRTVKQIIETNTIKA